MPEADRLLAQRFDVIVCGTHFAESKMFELLRHAKASQASHATPILCIRVLDGELDSTAFDGISLAATALGAAGFVDLNRWRREYGFDAAREKLRELVSSLAEPRR
jgi:CheY-like chemotaxis protein